MARRVANYVWKKNIFLFSSNYSISCNNPISLQHRSIFTTSRLDNSWMNKIKGVFTGNKSESGSDSSASATTDQPLTLLTFADQLGKARKLGALKEYVVGRSSEATFSDAFAKKEAILRYLAGFDPSGENLQLSQKQEAAKQLKCTMADVENTLAKYSWAKEAQKTLEKLKEEGKPLPKSFAEVQKIMGTSPLDVARSNMAKSGQISRNAFCPCGSKKRYKRCCGKD